jgi:uncharacterized protein (TIGR03000 family)
VEDDAMRWSWMRKGAGGLLLVALVVGSGTAQQPPKTDKITLIIKVREDATVEVDGTPTKQTGETRRFESPPVEVGKKYTYTVVARWEPNNYTKITRTRKVEVQPGKETTVDLREADPKQPDNIVIRFVPTPQFVVDAMLKLGEVGKDDVVYDLGCGDGRIVCSAVAKAGAKRGVGIDLDPERIKESRETAKREKVEDKVEFREANVLKIDDYSDATVVMLYMSDDLNLALRPILQKSLKPGARIVSHRFIMGDWKPDKTETLTDPATGEKYLIHLWKIEKK